jgi:hypothetical protein
VGWGGVGARVRRFGFPEVSGRGFGGLGNAEGEGWALWCV